MKLTYKKMKLVMRRFVILMLFVSTALLTSCGIENYFKEKVHYVVKVKTLNVRDGASSKAKVTNKLHRGDTITTYKQDSEFIFFIFGNDVESYVSKKCLTYLGPVPKLDNKTRIINFLNETIVWHSELFWVIILIGLIGGYKLSAIEDDFILYRVNISKNKIAKGNTGFHIAFIVIGVVLGIVYYINPAEVQNLIIHGKLSIIPETIFEWAVWLIVVSSGVTLIVNIIYSIIQQRLYCIITLPMSFVINAIALISYSFAVSGLIYLSLMALVVFGVYTVLNTVSKPSRGRSSSAKVKSHDSSKLTEDEKHRRLQERIQNEEKARVQREIYDAENRLEIMD